VGLAGNRDATGANRLDGILVRVTDCVSPYNVDRAAYMKGAP